MATTTRLITAEEYMALPDSFDGPTELVKGVAVTIPRGKPRHGQICARVAYILQRFLEDHPRGRVVTNDSGMLTERDPDTVRGPDVAYYSYERAPKGPLPDGLLPVSPDLVFEVRSPSDRWSEVHVKIAEYLQAGVQTVCVLDDDAKCIHAFHAERGAQAFELNADFVLSELLPDFQVPVRRFFE